MKSCLCVAFALVIALAGSAKGQCYGGVCPQSGYGAPTSFGSYSPQWTYGSPYGFADCGGFAYQGQQRYAPMFYAQPAVREIHYVPAYYYLPTEPGRFRQRVAVQIRIGR